MDWSDARLDGMTRDLAERLDARRLAWLNDHGGTARSGTAGPSRGTGLGWEAGRAVGPLGGLGVRIDWFAAGVVTGTFRGQGEFLERQESEDTLRASLSSFTFGGWLAGGTGGDVQARAVLFAGPAFGSVTAGRSSTVTGPETNQTHAATVSASGPGLAGNLAAELAVRVFKDVFATLESGYQWTWIPRMTYAGSADLDGDGTEELRRGALLENGDGDPLRVDFGGFYLAAGVRVEL